MEQVVDAVSGMLSFNDVDTASLNSDEVETRETDRAGRTSIAGPVVAGGTSVGSGS
jgi:hypothetical protein